MRFSARSSRTRWAPALGWCALPEGEPKTDWTAWFQPRTTRNPHGGHGWRDLRDLLVDSDLAGKQMFSIADAAAKWRKRQIEAPGLQLGFRSLDAVIKPGLKPGQVMLPLAKSGTGKTVFLSNLAHNCRGQRTLYVSLEMTAAEVFEHLRRIHHFWNPKATHDEMMLDYRRLQIVERNRIGPGDLGDLVAEYTHNYGGDRPQLLIVDYLQYYARGFRGGRHVRAGLRCGHGTQGGRQGGRAGVGLSQPGEPGREARHADHRRRRPRLRGGR